MHAHPITTGRRSLLKLFVNAARRFSGSSGGNVAMIFAFSAIPIIVLIGGAVDFSRASLLRMKMHRRARCNVHHAGEGSIHVNRRSAQD